MGLSQKVSIWSLDSTSYRSTTSTPVWGDKQQSTNGGSHQHDFKMIERLGATFEEESSKKQRLDDNVISFSNDDVRGI